jgi:hypothetical protein
MELTFRWVKPIPELQEAYRRYGKKVMVAIKAVADHIATRCQAVMRKDARWIDRTGNARAGLFSIAEQAAKDLVIIYLSHGHTISYGIYLETMSAGKYAIIMPVMQRYYPLLMKMLRGIFK